MAKDKAGEDRAMTLEEKREAKLNELVARQMVVDKAEQTMRISEADFRGKKKEHEKLVEEQQAFIRRLKEGEPPNLFDQEGMPPIKPTDAEIKAAEKAMHKQAAEAAAGQKPAATAADGAADAWKSASIDVLNLPAALAEKLKNYQPNGKSAGLDTLGGLAAYTSADKRLTDIPGVGKGSADKVHDAIAAYFAANPIQAADANKPAEGEAKPAAEGEAAPAAAEEKPAEAAEGDKPAKKKGKKK